MTHHPVKETARAYNLEPDAYFVGMEIFTPAVDYTNSTVQVCLLAIVISVFGLMRLSPAPLLLVVVNADVMQFVLLEYVRSSRGLLGAPVLYRRQRLRHLRGERCQVPKSSPEN